MREPDSRAFTNDSQSLWPVPSVYLLAMLKKYGAMSSQVESHPKSQHQVRRGAKALITTAERALLVKEAHSDGTQFWTLPGGGVETGESMADALERELAEELCCRVAIEEQTATFWYAHSSCTRTASLYTVFDCTLTTPTIPNRAEGVLDLRWISTDNLPANTLLGVRALLENEVDSPYVSLPQY